MKVHVDWIDKFHLHGTTEKGQTVRMDSTAGEEKPRGAAPKELILNAVAGCSMMDVVLILEKSKRHLEKFWVDVEGELAKEHPKVFTKIHLTYNFVGKDLDDVSVERAIELSRGKYCAVYGMLKNSVNITYSYRIYKEEVVENA
jgi:putative redox protein